MKLSHELFADVIVGDRRASVKFISPDSEVMDIRQGDFIIRIRMIRTNELQMDFNSTKNKSRKATGLKAQ